MPSALPRTLPARAPVSPAAGLLRRSGSFEDAQRLPPVRRLRAGARQVPAQSRIILRAGTIAHR
jgi:hypothetical protein